MNIKEFINAHFYPLGDTEANWEKVKDFIPPKKEFIIYEPDENHSYSRMKIGDGVTNLHELPFVADIDKIKENYIDPLEDKITTVQNEIVQPQVSVTWEELKQLRDESKLIPGQFYRIIDYYCTTIQENTRAMNNQFDIIVQALFTNTLSENASADYHEGDTYFQTVGSGSIIDSNINSEQVETILEDGDVEWIYCIYEDFGDAYNIQDGAQRSDAFVAFDFLENNNGVIVPVLFKNDMSLDEETGDPVYGLDDMDYHDAFFYVGEEVIDGEVYDKWRKIEGDGFGSGDSSEKFTWDSASKQYALTNKIVGEDLLIDATFTYDEGSMKKLANLPAWKLKYCLDNDINRFEWVDSENGRGVIYYMKDEWNNEAPYDFKNILFIISLTEEAAEKLGLEGNRNYNFYTFSCVDQTALKILDATTLPLFYTTDEGGINHSHHNIVKTCIGGSGISDRLSLPKNIIAAAGYRNEWYGFRNISFGHQSYENLVINCDGFIDIEHSCRYNTISGTADDCNIVLKSGIWRQSIKIEQSFPGQPVIYEANNTKHIILG